MILITVPNLSIPGGVSNIFKTISWDKSDNVKYFFNTTGEISSKVWFIPVMFIRYVKHLAGIRLVHLNPSLNAKGTVRDGLLLLLGKLFKKKVVVFFHGWDEEFEKVLIKNALIKKVFYWVFNRADCFIVIGSVFGEKLCRIGIKREIIRYLPTIADDTYSTDDAVIASTSKRTTINLLFISRFIPMKGMDIVLSTFNYLSKYINTHQFKLIMAGDGPELERCKEFVKQHTLRNVTFTGYIDGSAKHYWYMQSDILFFPSYSEGLPCVIMEAMLYGLAIVSRPIGGIPDWVKQYENGWLSESTNPEVFAKGILSLIEKPGLLEGIKRNNQRIAKSNFIPAKFKQRLYGVYEELLKN